MKDANIRPKHLDLIQQLMKLLVKEGEKYSEEEGGGTEEKKYSLFLSVRPGRRSGSGLVSPRGVGLGNPCI